MSERLAENFAAKRSVEGFLSSGKIPHAILIEGDVGSGRHSLAERIARGAVCEGQNKPCGICSGCHLAEVGSHPDISYILPEEGKKNITVDKVRTLRADAFVKPHMAAGRVFIIDGAERMNEQSQNALLKVLEEPPHGVIFILICRSRTALLETIVSRCSVLSLYIEDTNSPKEDSPALAAAERFLEQLFSGSELDMLYTLKPFEKDRVLADEFFAQLKLCTTAELRAGYKQTNRSRVLTALYGNISRYQELLKTNINLPLLFSAAVCESKQLI